MPGKAMVAATEAMLTIAPPGPAGPPGRIARKACFMPSAVPSEIDLAHARSVVGVRSMTSAGDLDAGVVDQDVQAAERLDRVRDGVLPIGVVGDVELGEAGLDVVAGEVRCRCPRREGRRS